MREKSVEAEPCWPDLTNHTNNSNTTNNISKPIVVNNKDQDRAVNPYSKVVGSLSVCLSVCVRLNNSGTAGLFWLNFFLLAPSWSQGGFRPKKIRIRDTVFPEIPNILRTTG